jgi:hypothetical protein
MSDDGTNSTGLIVTITLTILLFVVLGLIFIPRLLGVPSLYKVSCADNAQVSQSCICHGTRVNVEEPPLYCCPTGPSSKECGTA